MKKTLCIIVFLVLTLGAMACTSPAAEKPGPTATPTSEPEIKMVVFTDAILEARVHKNMKIPEGEITIASAEEVTFLDLNSADPWVPNEERIKDISALAYFKNLSSVYLCWNDIVDLTPLAELNNIEALYLSGNERIVDFSPLAGLINMKDFLFSNNEGLNISDSNIGFIVDMKQMERLQIQGASGLSDISAVAYFPNLYNLSLLNCNIHDVSPIAGLTNLRELYLLGNPISDFSPIKGIYANLVSKDFEIINADDVPEDPITFSDERLEAMVRNAMNITDRDITTRDAYLLTSLDLSTAFDSHEPKIKSIDDLSYFKNLKVLSFDFQEVSDLSPLSGLTKMERLSFCGNRVSDISALSEMNGLTGVYFFGNQVSDISPLSGKTNMMDLTIFSNQISDISPLAGMTNLGMLRMENNQVTDISVLSGFTSLAILMLKGNPIADFSPVKDIYPQLKEKDFNMN